MAADNVSTFFNLGFGNNYYLNGKQISNSKWNNYTEYDASLLLISTSQQTAISRQGQSFTYLVTTDIPHYVGGSSLLIKGSFTAESDDVAIKLQDIEISEDGIYDVKVAFKMDYKLFKKGEISLVLKYQPNEESKEDITEEFCIFSSEIKQGGLIYTESGWAIYDSRLADLSKGKASLELHLQHQQPIDFDIRIGHISIVPSFMVPPDAIKMTWESHIVQNNYVESCIQGTEIRDVFLSWKISDIKCFFRIFRNDLLVAVVKNPCFLDRNVPEIPPLYRVEGVSRRNEIVGSIDY